MLHITIRKAKHSSPEILDDKVGNLGPFKQLHHQVTANVCKLCVCQTVVPVLSVRQ